MYWPLDVWCPFGHIMLRHLIPQLVSAVMFVYHFGISTSMTTESTLGAFGTWFAGRGGILGAACSLWQIDIIAEYLVGDYGFQGYFWLLLCSVLRILVITSVKK